MWRLAEFAGSARAYYFRGVWEGGLGVDWFCFKGGAFGRVFLGSVTPMGLGKDRVRTLRTWRLILV